MDHQTTSYYRSNSSRGSAVTRSARGLLGGSRGAGDGRSSHVFLCAILILIFLGLLCYQIVWRQVRVSQAEYQLNQLQKRTHRLRMAVHRNEVVVSRLERLDRIQRIAQTQLGLTTSDSVPVLNLTNTQWVHVPPKEDSNP